MGSRKKIVTSLATIVLVSLLIPAWGAGQSSRPQDNPDRRPYLSLLPAERDLVLQEMRNFLHVIQLISDALARDDMDAVAKAARTMGSGAANEIPPRVVAKLPDDFKQFAGTVHTAFDTLALDAESLGDTKHTLAQLSTMLQTCAACHSVYQIPTSPSPADAKARQRH